MSSPVRSHLTTSSSEVITNVEELTTRLHNSPHQDHATDYVEARSNDNYKTANTHSHDLITASPHTYLNLSAYHHVTRTHINLTTANQHLTRSTIS